MTPGETSPGSCITLLLKKQGNLPREVAIATLQNRVVEQTRIFALFLQSMKKKNKKHSCHCQINVSLYKCINSTEIWSWLAPYEYQQPSHYIQQCLPIKQRIRFCLSIYLLCFLWQGKAKTVPYQYNQSVCRPQ